MELDQLIKHALDGNAVLFVGAGFSCIATNVNGSPLKTGRQLSAYLSDKCGLSEPEQLDVISDFYRNKYGVNSLIKLLNEEFQVSKIATEHSVYGRIPWKRIYTTNYDNVIELAYQTNGKAIVPITLEHAIRRVSEPTSQCIHINGFINELTEDTLFSTFKLTEVSYASSEFSKSQWYSQFHLDISAASAVLFLGYSVHDLDITRILVASSELKDKMFFVVGKNPSEVTRQRICAFGHMVAEDTAGFAERLTTVAIDYEPQVHSRVTGRYVLEIKPPAVAATPRDQDIYDLLLWGRINKGMIWSVACEAASQPYVCIRDAVTNCLQMLEDGESDIVVRSNLGNGKTVFLEELGAMAAQLGIAVHLLHTSGPGVAAELEDVLQSTTKTLLMIDGYSNKRSEVQIIARMRSDQLHVIYTARSLRHDISYEWLYDYLGVDGLPEIDLNRLTDSEICWFISIMDNLGLWQSNAKHSEKRKMEILKAGCGGTLSAILLNILQSPTISKRLEELVNSLPSIKDYRKATASILVLSVLEIGTTTEILSHLTDVSVMNQAAFRNSAIIRELIDFDNDSGVCAKNAVVAAHILTTYFDPNITVSALAGIAERADSLSHESRYWDTLVTLMRFTSVQSVLPSIHKMNAVIAYFERIKNLYSCKKNPQFWLQYAIAELTLGKFREARIKLQTARSFAEKKTNYNTFMIDLNDARLALEEAIACPKTDRIIALRTFREARKPLSRQVSNRENFHHPFRVAANYASFLDHHSSILNADDKAEIAKAARFMLRRINDLFPTRASHPDVVRCKKSMEEIMTKHPLEDSE